MDILDFETFYTIIDNKMKTILENEEYRNKVLNDIQKYYEGDNKYDDDNDNY